MPYGKNRRNEIMNYLLEDPSRVIYVNKKWCLLLKYDIDLKYLLKKGKLVKNRESWGSKFSRITYLKLA